MTKTEELIDEVLKLDEVKKAWMMTKDPEIAAHRILKQAQLADAAPILAKMLKKVIEQRENLLGLLQECNVDVTELRMLFNAELDAIARDAE